MRDEDDEMDPDLRSTSGGGAGPGIRLTRQLLTRQLQ